MDLLVRLQQPETMISIVSFVFGLGVVWATLKNNINTLQRKLEQIESLDLNTKIAQIQTDLERIKAKLNEK